MSQFSLSDLLALIALVVSIGNAYFTKQQSESARFSAENDYWAHLSAMHKPYREESKAILNEYRADFRELSQLADKTLDQLSWLIDQYDIQPSARPLRHLVDEAAEIVYLSFNGQLGWQTGLNISRRFYRFCRVEEVIKPSIHFLNTDSYFNFFENAYNSDKNNWWENEILKDKYFCGLVTEAKSRINPHETADFLLKIQEAILPFSKIYSENQERYRTSAEYLREILREGEMEPFPLSQSLKIYQSLRHTQATLEVLGHLVIPKIAKEYANGISHHTSHCIYIYALLHAVRGHEYWGWRELR